MTTHANDRPPAPVPARPTQRSLSAAVQDCRACDLWEGAAQAVLGSQIRIGRDRGRPIESDLADLVTVTTHPSSILRARSDSERQAAMEDFVADLEGVASWLGTR